MKATKDQISFPEIITTKLYPPQVRTSIVHRQRLFDKIKATPAKLVLLAAPAGFGKSTFVLDWLQENGSTYAWLSLDEPDNDPRRFYQYFCSALQTAGIQLGDDLFAALRGNTIPSTETIITQIVNTLHLFDSPVTIVFDDYYFIEERSIHNAVNLFLDHLPANVRLFISTRVDPLLPLHRMRVRGELIEIRERDLRFTIDEAREFFEKTMQIKLSQDDIKKLAARTEGWIAGLQLAAVSLLDSRDVQTFIDSFTGTSRYVLDYLLEEVLNRQSKETQMFLLQTSILKRFNEDICNTITGGMNARKIIDHLDRSNLFLIPLDDTREWFRYHHLFSELLQYRLRQLYPKLIDELHHNASVWFEEQSNISEAIDYALRVKNFDRAAYLLDRYGVHFLSRSELSTLINYERKLPPHCCEAYPRLLVSKAWALMLMHRTEHIDATIESVEKLLRNNNAGYTAEEIAEAKGHIATINAFVLRLRGNLADSLAASKRVLRVIPAENRMIRGLINFNMGRIYMKQGYAAKAIMTLDEALHDNFSAANYYVTLAILAHSGYLHSITGSLPEARRKLEEALAFAEQHQLLSLPAAGYIYYQLGRIMYHQNDLDNAIDVLEQAVHLGGMGNEPDIICNALFVLSWIHAVRGDGATAYRVFSRAEDIDKNSNVPVYEAELLTERVSLAILLNDLDTCAEWLKMTDCTVPDDFTVIDESRMLLILRYLVRSNDYTGALKLSALLRPKTETLKRSHTLLQLDILDAVSLWGLKKNSHAMKLLNHGLEKAAGMGYIRVLLNLGEQLYALLCAADKGNSLSTTSRRFVSDVLPLFTDKHVPDYAAIPKFRQKLIEPLTDREQEVLYHIAQNLTNKDIAAKLYISLDTVKTHLKHIYAKLGVNNRKDAVGKARDLGILHKL